MKHTQHAIVQGILLAALGPFAWAACTGDSTNNGPPTLPDASLGDVATGDDVNTQPDAKTGGDDTTPDASHGNDASSPSDAASDVVITGDEPVAFSTTDSFDAGSDCTPPGTEPQLSATAEGLPSDGLLLWVRGDHGVHKTASSDVCGWRDQTTNAVLLQPANPATRPSWGATSVGGRPAIHFATQGTDLFTNSVLGLDPTQARTFVAVEQIVALTGRFHPIIQGGDTAAQNVYLAIDANTYLTAGGREGAYTPGGAFDTMTTTATVPRVHVMTVSTLTAGTDATTAVDYRINGVKQTLTLTSGSTSMVSFAAATFTTIGAISQNTTTGTYGDAIVAEALIYSRALMDAEKQATEAALAKRYGIALGDAGTQLP
jgi:hypothetical protein